ncbi:MAG: cytochrome b [Proteobacteria bacterium]|nr:cytochrome b [Pseudomonadota bacterium]
MQDTWEKFSGVTVWLHWLVAVAIIGLLAVGLIMDEFRGLGLTPIHKSIGVLVFLLVLVRVGWRLKSGWPEPVSTYPKIEQILAKLTHWTLVICTLLMPISGMMMSGAGGRGFGIFGLQIVAANPDPANPGKVIPYNETIGGVGHEMHEIVSTVLMIAIGLHIVGALKHHMLDKDGTLRRMLGQNISAPTS